MLKEQQQRIKALAKNGVDVLIIGAGINGAGLYRDLCEQGVTCLIVDKSDFGSGTSAAPSRLIHGGLKYLETGEFSLVAQSTYERNLLLRNAPHCVEPLETVIPIFSWAKGIGPALKTLFGWKATARSRGALLIKTGLMLYDFYGAKARVMPRHAMWSRAQALREIPSFTPRIVAAGTYYDAKISRPERLVWELIKDGFTAQPLSAAMNYTAIMDTKNGAVSFTGTDGFAFTVKPKIVVNAAGPWIDAVNAKLGAPSKLIGGTKGSHIILHHPQLLAELNGRMIYFEADDGRILLAYPYEGHVLVGSTDQKADDPDNVKCEDWEIDYFIASLRSLLPALDFTHEQILYAYSGIRPLPASDAKSVGLISRDHSSPAIEPDGTRSFPIISLVGGKWTTFRGFAEEVADALLKRLSRLRVVSTASLAIGGGRDFVVGKADAQNARYGSTAKEISKTGEALQDASSYLLSEFEWIARNEMVQSLSDLVLRRTVFGLGGEVSLRDLESVADVAVCELGWSKARRASELKSALEILTVKHRVRLLPSASPKPKSKMIRST
ncbi:glycerol-3-phosphate dehydrogenase/oxidase [Aestuariivirga litoralis]|uniref:glycerol-3-phosphate dehydrogenase/oxidase n=1 Tax=Aestuariivirga litoralis TaxID=2650924 RepID=UPI0018C4AF9A